MYEYITGDDKRNRKHYSEPGLTKETGLDEIFGRDHKSDASPGCDHKADASLVPIHSSKCKSSFLIFRWRSF